MSEVYFVWAGSSASSPGKANKNVKFNYQLTIFAGLAQLLQDAWFPLLLLEHSAHDEQVILLLARANLVLVLPQVREVFNLVQVV